MPCIPLRCQRRGWSGRRRRSGPGEVLRACVPACLRAFFVPSCLLGLPAAFFLVQGLRRRTLSAQGQVSSARGPVSSAQGGVFRAENGIFTAQGPALSAPRQVFRAENGIFTAQGPALSAPRQVFRAQGGRLSAQGRVSSAQRETFSVQSGRLSAQGPVSSAQWAASRRVSDMQPDCQGGLIGPATDNTLSVRLGVSRCGPLGFGGRRVHWPRA